VAPSLRPGALPRGLSDKPLINSDLGDNAGAAAPSAEPPPELCGNVGVHGFWRRGATAIFDIRVTDADAPYHCGQDPHKILAKHEKEKKDKYVKACLAQRHTFTPLLFLVHETQPFWKARQGMPNVFSSLDYHNDSFRGNHHHSPPSSEPEYR
jgi:hypothetical protein